MDPSRAVCVFCAQAGVSPEIPAEVPSTEAPPVPAPLPAKGKNASFSIWWILGPAILLWIWIRANEPAGKSSEPSIAAQCSAARADIVIAKDERNAEQAELARRGLSSEQMEVILAAHRQRVQDIAARARAIPGCNIDDLVGPGVGR